MTPTDVTKPEEFVSNDASKKKLNAGHTRAYAPRMRIMTTRIPETVYRAAQRVASADRRPLSNWVRALIEDAVMADAAKAREGAKS